MANNEWTLVSFTLLAQLTAGAWFLHSLLMPYKNDPTREIHNVHKKLYSILLPIVLISLVLSFFHLGNPTKAIHALNNLEFSWLSREILFISLLAGFTILLSVMLRKPHAKSVRVKTSAYLGSMVAFLLVYSMSEIYMLETLPAWNSIHTPLEFFTCSLLLGGFLILLIYKGNARKLEDAEYGKISRKIYLLFILLSVVFVIDLGNAIFHHFIHFDPSAPGDVGVNYLPRILRFVLLVVGLTILIFQFYYFNLKKKLSGISGIAVAFFILLLAEIIGRFIFYSAYQSF